MIMAESVRLQKYISDCGVMSRRASEDAIRNGDILVDGRRVEPGIKIVPGVNAVTLRGTPVVPRSAPYTYVLINKPRGIVTTSNDEKGRRCVLDLLPPTKTRLYPVGRLDMDSDGLLILTDDGAFTNLMTHPRHHVPKTYVVRTEEVLTQAHLHVLNGPMVIEGYRLKPVEIVVADDHTFVIRLHEGRNRQIRKMCKEADLRIKKLTRIAIGPVEIGDLKPGAYRYLTSKEIKSLEESIIV